MKAKTADKLATRILWVISGGIVLLLASMLGYLLYLGVGSIDWNFLTADPKSIDAGGGIGPEIYNSFCLLFLAMIITVPLGLLAAIFLSHYAKPGTLTEAIRLSTETLASLPSIVVGLFGLLVFVTMTGWQYSLLAGAMALTVLNLPVMVRVCEEAIRSVPRDLTEGSLALGASRWQTIWRIVIPGAFPGLVTGFILTAGRVFGEAAALLYTAGMSAPTINWHDLNPTHAASPLNLFRPAETLAVHIWKTNSESLIPDISRVANGTAAVLVIVVVLFNISARWIGRRMHQKMTASSG